MGKFYSLCVALVWSLLIVSSLKAEDQNLVFDYAGESFCVQTIAATGDEGTTKVAQKFCTGKFGKDCSSNVAQTETVKQLVGCLVNVQKPSKPFYEFGNQFGDEVVFFVGKQFFTKRGIDAANNRLCELLGVEDESYFTVNPGEDMVMVHVIKFDYHLSGKKVRHEFNETPMDFIQYSVNAEVARDANGEATAIRIQCDDRTELEIASLKKCGNYGDTEEIAFAIPAMDLKFSKDLLKEKEYSWLEGATLLLDDNSSHESVVSRFLTEAKLAVSETGISAESKTTLATVPKGIVFPEDVEEGTIIFDETFYMTIKIDGKTVLQFYIENPKAE